MQDDVPELISDQVRAACARVAARSRSAGIEEAAIEAYAGGLPPVAELAPPDPATDFSEGDREGRIAFVVCLDAINFGSGWWPMIRKRAGRSGYFTIAAGLSERFRSAGAWSANQLSQLDAADLGALTGQDPALALMGQYAASLRDVGEHVLAEYGGSFEALVEAAAGSAAVLADLLAGWQAFADVSTYEGEPAPFYKRAQITAADLNRSGVATLAGEERLTAFADNLVPHVLRLDGVLLLDPALEAKIEAGALLEHGSAEEVELRACAVHAVELVSAASRLSPAQIDAVLWNRGAGARYKSVPRPRSRNTAY
jgi:Potential Queuosine, Q, salvage protein family